MTDPTNSDEVKLLPCPFCGDDEELRVDQPLNMYGYWVVHCGCCGGEMQAESEAGAIAAWNTRAIEATDEVVERVARAIRESLFKTVGPSSAYADEYDAARAAIAAMKDAASD